MSRKPTIIALTVEVWNPRSEGVGAHVRGGYSNHSHKQADAERTAAGVAGAAGVGLGSCVDRFGAVGLKLLDDGVGLIITSVHGERTLDWTACSVRPPIAWDERRLRSKS